MLARLPLAVGLALVCGANMRAAIGEAALPGEFSVAPMAQRLRLNGLPLEIYVLDTALAPRQACALVAERWAGVNRAALLGCRQGGEWLLVSLCADSHEMTVQLRAAATGSRGYLSIVDLHAHPARPPTPRVPMPLRAQVRNVLQASGPDGATVQFTVAMPMSPAIALRRLTESAAQAGWKLSAPLRPSLSGTTFELRRGGEWARGLLTRDDGGSGLVLIENNAGPGQP